MVKEIQYDSNYFKRIIGQIDSDLEELTEFNFKIVKVYFNSIDTLLNRNPQSNYETVFGKLEELDSMKLINNNCSTTLFVFGRFYELIADMMDYNQESNENRDMFLVSVNKALFYYGKTDTDRTKNLLDKHKSNLKEITETSYKLILDK